MFGIVSFNLESPKPSNKFGKFCRIKTSKLSKWITRWWNINGSTFKSIIVAILTILTIIALVSIIYANFCGSPKLCANSLTCDNNIELLVFINDTMQIDMYVRLDRPVGNTAFYLHHRLDVPFNVEIQLKYKSAILNPYETFIEQGIMYSTFIELSFIPMPKTKP